MRDYDEDEEDDDRRRRRTPTGRVYVHKRCGGHTRVSGGDFSHICDPFWPCTGTYCCECEGFAPLREVRWADTGETVARYRSRLRAETPLPVKAWRYGAGFLVGGGLGGVVGLLVAVAARVPDKQVVSYAAVGGLIGAVACYLIGTFALNRVFAIDYRRER